MENQREVLQLLQVRVTLLDDSQTPALRIEGELPGGGEMFGGEPIITGGAGGGSLTGAGATDPASVGPQLVQLHRGRDCAQ